MALYASILFNIGQKEEAKSAAERITFFQNPIDGKVEQAVTSITSSWGDDLIVEATSFSAIAWMQIGNE